MSDKQTELLTTKELAKELRLDVSTVREAIAQGQLPVVRNGQRNMVSRKALDRWLDGTTKPAAC